MTEKYLDEFGKAIGINIGKIYDRARVYFRDHVDPDEIYTIDQLEKWAHIHRQLMSRFKISAQEARKLIPEDVFSEKDLENWATDNGFVRGEIELRACDCDNDHCTACMKLDGDNADQI